jgi:hypothetical protein
MIPKIIHYCWFGKGFIPKSQRDCITKWGKVLPDYEIKRWDERNFDVNFCDYSREAYDAKKFAYVSDVARCLILHKYGGIYLDTDVEVFKRFDSFLSGNFFSAIEVYKEFQDEGIQLLDENRQPKNKNELIPYMGFLSSVVGCCPDNCLIKDCLDYYLSLKVHANNFKGFAIDGLLANQAVKYGFVYKDERQVLENNMLILSTGTFGYLDAVNPDYSILYHYNAGSWAPKTKHQLFLLKLDKFNLLNIYKVFKSIRKSIKGKINKV